MGRKWKANNHGGKAKWPIKNRNLLQNQRSNLSRKISRPTNRRILKRQMQTIALIAGICANGIMLVSALFVLLKVGRRIERAIEYFAREHEILMKDYSTRAGVPLEQLPTRLNPAPWWKG